MLQTGANFLIGIGATRHVLAPMDTHCHPYIYHATIITVDIKFFHVNTTMLFMFHNPGLLQQHLQASLYAGTILTLRVALYTSITLLRSTLSIKSYKLASVCLPIMRKREGKTTACLTFSNI